MEERNYSCVQVFEHESEDESQYSPLYYGSDEMELSLSLNQELERAEGGLTFQRGVEKMDCIDDGNGDNLSLSEVEGEGHYSEADLNSSLLLSDKFELSRSGDLIVPGEEGMADCFVDDLNEEDLEKEETMGGKYL